MGLTPPQVDGITLPAMAAMFAGFRQFHSGEDRADEPDEDEFHRALAEEMAAGNVRV